MRRWSACLTSFVFVALVAFGPVQGARSQEGADGGGPDARVTEEAGSPTAGTVEGQLPPSGGEETAAGASAEKGMTLFELLLKGGVVGGLIILLSCVALGLVIDYATKIRRKRLAPPEDVAARRRGGPVRSGAGLPPGGACRRRLP